MSSLRECCVPKVAEPVRLLFGSSSAYRSHDCHTVEELDAYLTESRDSTDSSLVISICQRNSWRPLQVSAQMLEFIFSHCHIDPTVFGDIPLSFCQRSVAIEEGFCVPFTQLIQETSTEVAYTIRYPEFKEQTKEWVIRQTGVYHRFDASTQKSIYLLLSPTTNSKAHLDAQEFMATCANSGTTASPMWFHQIVASAYLPAWRQYIAVQEHDFLQIRNLIFATFIDTPLPTGYDTLSRLVSLENRFLQMQVISKQVTETLEALLALPATSNSPAIAGRPRADSPQALAILEWHKTRCSAYSRTSEYLHQRTQSTVQLLTLTLSLQDQAIAKDQNNTMLRLNKAVAFITIISLFYLPASFASTFFGMNFFGLDEESGRLFSTHMIWIYVLSTVVLTACTFALYSIRVKGHHRLGVASRYGKEKSLGVELNSQ